MAVSEAAAVILKNDDRLLPVVNPTSMLLIDQAGLTGLEAAIRHQWPDCEVATPATANATRLQTLARRHPLALVCLRIGEAGLGRASLALIDKLGRLRQTLVVLCSNQPVALGQWHRQQSCLLWAPLVPQPAQLTGLLAGQLASGRLPFPLPFNSNHLVLSVDGDWQLRDDRQPAFAAGFGAPEKRLDES